MVSSTVFGLIFSSLLATEVLASPLGHRPSGRNKTGLETSALPDLHCGQWEFYGVSVGEETANSQEACFKLCTGDCDVFIFDEKRTMCYKYNSKVDTSDDTFVTFYAGNKLCSATFKGEEPEKPEDYCEQTVLKGKFLEGHGEDDDNNPMHESHANCKAECLKTDDCTNAHYSLDLEGVGYCTLFSYSEDGPEEFYEPNASACRVK